MENQPSITTVKYVRNIAIVFAVLHALLFTGVIGLAILFLAAELFHNSDLGTYAVIAVAAIFIIIIAL